MALGCARPPKRSQLTWLGRVGACAQQAKLAFQKQDETLGRIENNVERLGEIARNMNEEIDRWGCRAAVPATGAGFAAELLCTPAHSLLPCLLVAQPQ